MNRLIVPVVLVVLLTAGYAGVALYNRGGDAVVMVTLTERELALVPTTAASAGDDPGVRLRVVVSDGRDDALDALSWLTPARLTALGFDVTVPVGSPDAPGAYAGVLPRLGYVVLEYDGPAWQALARRPARASAPRFAEARSRLVPVDAGPDRDELAARYADGRHLVLPAILDLDFIPVDRGGPLVHGVLREVVPASLAVPSPARAALAGLVPRWPERVVQAPGEPVDETAPAPVPRYEVDLAVGRLGLPFVVAVRRLP